MDLFLFRQEQQTGPYTEADARALVETGQIDRACLAWHEGMTEWIPLERVLELPASRPQPAVPIGLPPVPTRIPRQTGTKDTPGDLSKRFLATKFGQAVERHERWLMPVLGGILILITKMACYHSP